MKSWLGENTPTLEAIGVDRIDTYYTDNGLPAGAFDEVDAYSVVNANKRLSRIARFHATADLLALLETLLSEDGLFSPEGGDGVFRLMIPSCEIEHDAYEFKTVRGKHAIENTDT